MPRLVCGLLGGETCLPLGAAVWGDTRIDRSPLSSQRTWSDVLSGDSIKTAVESGPSLPLAAAFAAQQALHAEAWPDSARIRVRIALDTGAAELRSGDCASAGRQFGADPELVFEVELSVLHAHWDGIKCVYRLTPE